MKFKRKHHGLASSRLNPSRESECARQSGAFPFTLEVLDSALFEFSETPDSEWGHIQDHPDIAAVIVRLTEAPGEAAAMQRGIILGLTIAKNRTVERTQPDVPPEPTEAKP